jgi:hypothetical protein
VRSAAEGPIRPTESQKGPRVNPRWGRRRDVLSSAVYVGPLSFNVELLGDVGDGIDELRLSAIVRPLRVYTTR